MQDNRFARLIAALIVAAAPLAAPAQEPGSVEREVRARMDALRAIQPGGDQARLEANNRKMDETWKYFDANRARALPVLRTELAAEITRPDHNNLVLLGGGFYLYTHGDKTDRDPARNALFAIDPAAPIVRWNMEQYFFFVHAVSIDRDPRILGLIDRAFLDRKVELVIPELALNLDESSVCMFLYGAYGDGAEAHLQPFLKDPKRVRKTLEILIWIGTPASNAVVFDTLKANRDIEVFGRATAFLMQNGGPEGRQLMLSVDPATLEPKSAEFYSKGRPHIEAVSEQWYKGLFDRFQGTAKLSDADVRQKLAAMKAGRGRDESLSPKAIYTSGIPRDELIGELMAARAAMLRQLYDQSLDDVRMTNMMINGLRFRAQ